MESWACARLRSPPPSQAWPRPGHASSRHAPQVRPLAWPAGGPLVQYVVLRRDLWAELGWPLGSVVAQACHASTAALWLSREQAEAAAYCAPGNLDHMHKAGAPLRCASRYI